MPLTTALSTHPPTLHTRDLTLSLSLRDDGACDVQWLLAESWNKGVGAFRESKLEEAESWMASAFTFSNYSSALAPWREELNDGYQVCLKMLNEQGPNGRSKAEDWKQRMSKRILESDAHRERSRQGV